MLDLAEEYGMKIALQYDAKIHFANWVPSTRGLDRAAHIQGLIDDFVYILDNFAHRKSYLKFNGMPVINPFGTNLLTDAEWGFVRQEVRTLATGYHKEFFLMADRAPFGRTNNIDAAYNWIALNERMNPESRPSYDDIYAWAVEHNKRTYDWARGDFANRFGIGHAWPGFNDEGVGGNWGSGTARRFAYNTSDAEWWMGPADPKGSTLNAIQYSNLEAMPDWILYATFNDWNEATSIEPSVEFGYRYLQEVQRFLEVFKGIDEPADENLMRQITEAYLANLTTGQLTVTGPDSLTIFESGEIISIDEFIITGKEPITVTVTADSRNITWNDANKTLDIAPGIEPGRYHVAIRASDGVRQETILNFRLTVRAAEFAPTDDIENTNVEPDIEDSENRNNIIAIVLSILAAAAVCTGILFFIIKHKKRRNEA
jgi:hypothetical protein